MRAPEEQTGHDPIEELLAAYALNAVEPHERAVVELVLAQDDRYQGLLAQYMEASAALSNSYTPLAPAPRLRQRVLDAIRGRPTGLVRPVGVGAGRFFHGRESWRIWTAAAVLLLAVGTLAGFSAYQQGLVQRLEDQLGLTRDRVIEHDQAIFNAVSLQQASTDRIIEEVDWTKEQLQLARAAFYWVVLPGVETVILEPSIFAEATTDQKARAMFMMTPDGKAALLIAVGLTPPKEETTYQAWLWEKNGTPVSAAIFTPDSTGYAQVFVRIDKDPAMYSGVSISTEPASGSTKPSGATVLSGPMLSP